MDVGDLVHIPGSSVLIGKFGELITTSEPVIGIYVGQDGDLKIINYQGKNYYLNSKQVFKFNRIKRGEVHVDRS